jgi:signal transduction histidine kinase
MAAAMNDRDDGPQVPEPAEPAEPADRKEALGWRAAGLRHDLNNALTCVFGELHVLGEALEAVRRASEPSGLAEAAELGRRLDACATSARAIEAALAAAAGQARELQALHRGPEAPRARAPADLRAAVERSMAIAEPCLRRVAVELAVLSVPVALAEETLVRVLLNLVSNAWQAFPEEQSDRRLELRATVSGRAVILDVADNGPGIAPAILPRLFQRFVTSKPRTRGGGIGLALSRELTRAAGGDLELLETGARGTVFRLTLPLAD